MECVIAADNLRSKKSNEEYNKGGNGKGKIKFITNIPAVSDRVLNRGFNKLELLYVGPIEESWRNINQGEIVGESINLQSLGYPSSVGQHVHLQIKLNGLAVNPTPYFPGLK